MECWQCFFLIVVLNSFKINKDCNRLKRCSNSVKLIKLEKIFKKSNKFEFQDFSFCSDHTRAKISTRVRNFVARAKIFCSVYRKTPYLVPRIKLTSIFLFLCLYFISLLARSKILIFAKSILCFSDCMCWYMCVLCS